MAGEKFCVKKLRQNFYSFSSINTAVFHISCSTSTKTKTLSHCSGCALLTDNNQALRGMPCIETVFLTCLLINTDLYKVLHVRLTLCKIKIQILFQVKVREFYLLVSLPPS